MIDTGPIPAIRDEIPLADTRSALLDAMGARTGSRFSRYHFPTADAVIDPDRGVLFIVVDPEPEPGDWNAVVGLIRAVGYTNGLPPHRRDPGEPEIDPLWGICTWRLEYVQPSAGPCDWCDGIGTPYGCPLCQTTC